MISFSAKYLPQNKTGIGVKLVSLVILSGLITTNPVMADDVGKTAQVDKLVADLKSEVETMSYQDAQFHPLHFPPAINTADDRQCLVCHEEILQTETLPKSPAGVESANALAWYQTLDTYEGDQMTFHQRHLESPYAKKVMNLSCNFCHQGNDPREEHPDMMLLDRQIESTKNEGGHPPFTLRKMVNPSDTCLRCHGAMPDPQEIMGLPGPWPEARKVFESAEGTNGCLTCHAAAFRTERHQVTYLNAENIEEAAKTSSDVCYGCHGGRAWYEISYPYPRHPWPLMNKEVVPDWAKGRPDHSDPRYAISATK